VILVGTIAVVVGATVNVLGRHSLGRNWANQVTVYESQTLVTSGIFGWLRHPLYASLIWMFVGAALAYHNAAAMAAALLLFVPAMYYRSGQEEHLLSERFPEYAAYRARTGRFFPCRRKGVDHGDG
jgi:protein-S-isoprenylcysteine O-methyltransferase Ste14